jgi:hypothetical protein
MKRFLAVTILASTAAVLLSGHIALAKKASADAAAAAAAAMARNVVDSDCLATVGPLLEAADGKLTPDVRSVYLGWAQRRVMRDLSEANQSIPEDCLAEVRADAEVRDAMFGVVFPPDPSILQNYAHLRSELGVAFTRKYRGLVIATAVGKRVKGEETDSAVLDVTGLAPPPAKGAKAEKSAKLVDCLADFLKTNQFTALQVYQDPARQQQLATYLKSHDVDAGLITKAQQPNGLGGFLKEAMVRLGQRPAARQPAPSIAAWLQYLASIYEATPSSTPTLKGGRVLSWPLFPIDKAPWPLLMPLARPVPLDEARYIWETFQGQHGPDRYHTYGPYRSAAAALPYELQPSPWHWQAWPDRIFHGGECVSISIGTVDLYSSLCKPAVHAGQPGHANLISFQWTDQTWMAEIEQAFAGGPNVTFAQWYFNQDPGTGIRFRKLYNWAGAEYHLGLALGMNLSLQSYTDTRIAANLFSAMSAERKQTLGARVLSHARDTNPFDPEIWYRLAMQTPDAEHGLALAKAAATHDPGGLDDEPRNVTLEQFEEVEHSKPVNAAMIKYWRTLEEFVARYGILRNPVPANDAEGREVYAFLQSVPGIKAEDLTAYTARFGPPATPVPAAKKKAGKTGKAS